MSRETKKITTPSGHELEVYTYLTGRDERKINAPMYESIDTSNVTPESAQEFNIRLTPEVIEKQEDLLIETLVASVNGESDNVLDTILDFRSADYKYVVDSLREIQNDSGVDEQRKKK